MSEAWIKDTVWDALVLDVDVEEGPVLPPPSPPLRPSLPEELPRQEIDGRFRLGWDRRGRTTTEARPRVFRAESGRWAVAWNGFAYYETWSEAFHQAVYLALLTDRCWLWKSTRRRRCRG